LKKLICFAALLCCFVTPAFAGVLMYTVSVDQATKMYVGSDLTNYTLLPANTFRAVYANNASQITFSQTSSAKTSTPNVRVEYMNLTGGTPVLSKDRDGQKLQYFRTDSVGNYYLTKSTTLIFN
jgi:hypothetical protein